MLGGAGIEREPGILKRAFIHQHWRRNGTADAAECLGNYLARAEKIDRVDARERRARHAHASRSGAAGALGVPRFARGILDVVPNAFLYGRRGTLPIPQRDREIAEGSETQ